MMFLLLMRLVMYYVEAEVRQVRDAMYALDKAELLLGTCKTFTSSKLSV